MSHSVRNAVFVLGLICSLAMPTLARAGGLFLSDPTVSRNGYVLQVCAFAESYGFSAGKGPFTRLNVVRGTVASRNAPAESSYALPFPVDKAHFCFALPWSDLPPAFTLTYTHHVEFDRALVGDGEPVDLARAPARVTRLAARLDEPAVLVSVDKATLAAATECDGVATYLKVDGKTPYGTPTATITGGVHEQDTTLSWVTWVRNSHDVIDAEYRFRLYPGETDWSEWSTNKERAFSYVPPGIHLFEVETRAVVGATVCELPPATFQFTIETPFIAPGERKGASREGYSPATVPAYSGSSALLLGVASYDAGRSFGNLEFVADDLAAMQGALSQSGFKTNTLPNASPTSKELREAIAQFLAKTSADERVILYYSGHGFDANDGADRRLSYLAGSDCDINRPSTTCYSLDEAQGEIRKAMERKNGPRHVVLVVDACAAGWTVDIKGFTADAAVARTRGAHIVTAGTQGQYARRLAGSKESLFTHYLVAGIDGQGDVLADGAMSLSELLVWVRWNVAKDSGGDQVPSFHRIQGSGELMWQLGQVHGR